ncbi:MAG: hypothetical protein JNM51_09400, partial [Bacteroidia bacterium]|nr:hypothetical protein [Bacteroidia bacterium]
MKPKKCLIYNILLLLCLINIKANALSVAGIDTIYKEQIIKVGQQKLNTLILQNEQYLKEGKTDKLNFVVNVNPEDYIEDRSIANKPSYLSTTSVESSLNARLNQVASTYNISCYYILISYLDVKISAIMPDQYTLDELFNTGKFFQENTNINEMKQYHDDITKNIISNITSASRNYFVFSMAKYYASEFHNSLGYYNFYKMDTVRVAGSPEILHFKDTYTYFKTHLKNNKEFRTTQLSDNRVDKAILSLESAAKNAPLKAQILTTYTTAGLKSILDAFSGYTDYITLSVAERIHVISVMLNDAIFGSSFTAEEIYTLNII